ncbi:hypothetical protein Daus18300_009538 [Diaporthe australafricana]|uniref:Uncharacterized protein n=1 Tax=Diaporthe australafricana TaxID=127596 RepID=A0ABR3WDK5_9PEZI
MVRAVGLSRGPPRRFTLDLLAAEVTVADQNTAAQPGIRSARNETQGKARARANATVNAEASDGAPAPRNKVDAEAKTEDISLNNIVKELVEMVPDSGLYQNQLKMDLSDRIRDLRQDVVDLVNTYKEQAIAISSDDGDDDEEADDEPMDTSNDEGDHVNGYLMLPWSLLASTGGWPRWTELRQ